MYYYTPTQEDFSIIRQQTKDIFVKVELLNRDFKTLDTFDAVLIDDNISVDSQSYQRRNYSCNLYLPDASFIVGDDHKIWIDKYIRVHYGIKSLKTKQVKYWLIGTFSYQTVDYTYDAVTKQLSLKCLDMMADYDGTKNGQVGEYELLIPAGEDIRKSIVGILEIAGITKYYVEDIKKEIPYDLEFTGTYTYCDILTKICELYDSWEFFFDVDGTFIWRKIPTGLHEEVSFDDTFIDKTWISENTSYDFTGIYNKTEVWGKVLELEYDDRYTEDTSFAVENGVGVYTVMLPKIGNKEDYENIENEDVVEYIESLDEIDNLDQIGFKVTADSIGNDMVRFNSCSPIPIVNDDGTPIVAGRMKANQTYVFSYRRNMGETQQNCLYLLGQYQCHGVYIEENPDCPFSVGNLGYEILNRVDYDELYSDDLCYNQAEYLTYQSTALLDTITLELLTIPWLNVNQKIKYTSKTTGETNQYIIKSFNWSSLSGTMSMTLYKFLESFNYVKNRER